MVHIFLRAPAETLTLLGTSSRIQSPGLPFSVHAIHFNFSLLLIASGIVTAVAGFMAAQRRSAPSAPAVVACMVAGTWWSVSYAMVLMGTPPSTRFWLTSMFLGVIATPPAFLLFALLYTDRIRWLNRMTLFAILAPPATIAPLMLTDVAHGLFFGNAPLRAEVLFETGPVFWANVVYAYLADGVAFLLLIQAVVRSRGLQRRQSALLLAGALAPTFANAATVFVIGQSTNLDVTPIGFAFTGMAMVYNLRTHGLFDVIPVARDAVVDGMMDGVMVLDSEDRLIDANPAARRYLGVPAGPRGTGARLLSVATNPVFARRLLEIGANQPSQLSLDDDGGVRTFDIRASILSPSRTRQPVRLYVVRDITATKRTEAALREQLAQNEALQEQLRQQAVRDPLTGLFNRRFLEETLERELARIKRDKGRLSVAMIDIDHFKQVNDTYGHGAGDAVLQALGETLRAHTRGGDVACRFGGEEFVLVMPDAPLASAVERTDTVRQTFAASPVQYGGQSITVTFSAGVAGFPEHGDDARGLLRSADRALYEAKGSGRNRVTASVTAAAAAREADQGPRVPS